MPRNNIYKFLKYANTGEEEDKKPIGLSDYISEGHATDDLALGLAHMFEGMADMTERALRPDNMTPTEWKEHQGGVLKNYLTGLRGSAANLAEGREQPELEEFSAPYFLRGALMSAPETVATMVPAALIGGPLGAGAAGVGRMIGAPLVRGMLSTAQGRALEFALQKAYQSENLGGKLARALTPNNAPMLGAMHVGAMMEANSERQQEINAQIRKALENGTYRPDETELAAERATQGIYDKDKWLITALNYPQFRAFATPTKSLLGNLGWGIGGTLAEGTEEALQEVVRATEMGEPVQGRNLASSFGTGMLLGGAMHGIGSTANYASRQISGQAERDRQIEEALNAYKEQRKEYSDRVGRVTVNDDGTDAYDNTPYGDARQAARDIAKAGNNGIDAFMRAIGGQESGGDYDAVNYAAGEMRGKFQIDVNNWAQWAQDAGLSPDAPMTPENQELVARNKMLEYYNKYGNWRDVASMWYSGHPISDLTEEEYTRPQYAGGQEYPSIKGYVDSIMSRFQEQGGEESSGRGRGGNVFGVENYDMPTQGDNITQQVSQLKNGWSDVIPQIGGVLKEKFGLNATISSAARSADHNAEVGGAPNSYHIVRDEGGDALDIVFDRDTTQEEQDRIADYFKGTGLFSEVLYHDVGSGAHLHLGGLKTENLSNGVQFDSRTLTRPSETRRTQHNQLPQEETPKPLFDLNAEDEQTQKLLERFASERVQSLANAENPDRGTLGFFTGLFNEANEFQNTEANRAALRERYGDEITSWANEILKQESPAQPAAPARTQSRAPRQSAPKKVTNEDILAATDDFLGRLRTDRTNVNTLLELQNARQAGDVAKMESILRQNNVEIAPVESTAPVAPSPQPPVQSENVVQNNQPPENILTSEQETAQPQQETNTATPKPTKEQKQAQTHINRVSKATNLANKNRNALDNIINSIQWLAAQNNIVIPAEDLTKLKKRSLKTISKWRDRLTEAGALTVKPVQETTSAPPAPQQTTQPPAAETTATPKETPLQTALQRARQILDTQEYTPNTHPLSETQQRQDTEQDVFDLIPTTEDDTTTDESESPTRESGAVEEPVVNPTLEDKRLAERRQWSDAQREIQQKEAEQKAQEEERGQREALSPDIANALAPASQNKTARQRQGEGILNLINSTPFRNMYGVISLPRGLDISLRNGDREGIRTTQTLLQRRGVRPVSSSPTTEVTTQTRGTVTPSPQEQAPVITQEAPERQSQIDADSELAVAPISTDKRARKEQGKTIKRLISSPQFVAQYGRINLPRGLDQSLENGDRRGIEVAQRLIQDRTGVSSQELAEREETAQSEREAIAQETQAERQAEQAESERRAIKQRHSVLKQQKKSARILQEEADADEQQFVGEMIDSMYDDVEAREELFNDLMDKADEQERQQNAKNAELEQRAQKARKKALAPVSESKSRRKEQGRAIEHFLKAPSLKVASDKINATPGLMRGIREGSKQALNDALQIINDEINAQNERREIERREREAAEARRNEPSEQEKLDAERRADRRRRDVRDEQADEYALSAQEEDIDRRYQKSQRASENAQQGLMEGTAESVQRQRENDQAHREWESEDLDDLFYLEEEIADLDRTKPEPREEPREEKQENVTRQEQPAQEDDRDVFDLPPESNELNDVEENIDAEREYNHTFTTKIGKDGKTRYYMDGKQVSRTEAVEKCADMRDKPFTIEYQEAFWQGDEIVTRQKEKTASILTLKIAHHPEGYSVYFYNGYATLATGLSTKADAQAFIDKIETAYFAGKRGVKTTLDGTVSELNDVESAERTEQRPPRETPQTAPQQETPPSTNKPAPTRKTPAEQREERAKNRTPKQQQPEGEPESNVIKGEYGNEAEIESVTGVEHQVKYKVVEASDLVTSHERDEGGYTVHENPNFPQELQPRDRETVSMTDALRRMIGHLIPKRFFQQALSANIGAPVVRKDGVILNGNGRTIAVIESYKEGKADNYKEALIGNAQKFGINPSKVAKMKQPILVREIVSDDLTLEQQQDIARDAEGGAKMGAREQAKADAKRISEKTLTGFNPNDIDLSASKLNGATLELLTDVLRDILTGNEINAYTDAKGNISTDGITRAKNALFAYAYGSDELLTRSSEASNDDNIRNVTAALMNAAPQVAIIRAGMQSGLLHNYNFNTIVEAVGKLSDLRKEGKAVKDFLRETQLAGMEFSNEAREILSFIDRNGRSAKRITEFFQNIAQGIQSQGDPKQGSLFGANEPIPFMDLIKTAIKKIEGGMDDLFAAPKEKSTTSKETSKPKDKTQPKADITGAPNIDTSNVAAEKDLTPAQKLLVSFGKKLGVRVIFFDNPDGRFRGVHKEGYSLLNVNSNKALGKVFWHESFHWLKNNNPELYKALVKAAGITDAQRKAYLETSKRTDLQSNEEIDEEILADMMDDVAKRTGLFQSIAGKNRGLIERAIQWFKDTLNKFIDHFRNPQGKLTTAQAQALASEFGRIANQLKDPNGNQIFRYNRRTHNVELADNRERTEAELAEMTAKNAQFEAKYSVDSNDNSTKSFKQRVKNLLGVEGKNIPIHKQMKRQLEDLSDMKIAADHLPEGVQVKIDKIAKVIRTGREYDWANILPEVGNAVAEQLGITQSAEMGNYIGKFILNGAPNDTSAEAKEFAKAMRENTEMRNKVMAIRSTFDTWNNMSAEEQMIASTRYDKEIPPLKERAQKFWQYLRTELFDTQMPIHYHVAKFVKATGIKLSESINPEIAFRNLRGMQQRAMRMVYGNELTKEALQKMYPNVDFSNWKPIAMILESIKAEPGSQKYKQFDQFVKACHFLDIHQHNYKVLGQQNKVRDEIRKLRDELDKADTKKKKAELERSIKKKEESLEALKQKIMDTPDAYTYDKCADLVLKYSEEFGEAQKDLVRYSRALLDIWVDSGMMDRRRYHQLLEAYPNYVPLHREFDENPNLNTADSMKQMLGSAKDVKDAIAAIANNTFDYIQRTEKNKAKLLLANLANFDGVGGIFELVDGSTPNDGTIIHFYENGKRKALQCSDEDIVKAVNSMNQPTMNLFLKVLQVPALMLRATATGLSPGFILGNFLRDPQDAFMVSKRYGAKSIKELPMDFITNPFITWKYVADAVHMSPLYEEYAVSGAAQSDFFSFDRDYKAEAIERLTKKNYKRFASPKGVIELLGKLGEWSELATRLRIYDKVKKSRAKEHGGINIYDDLVTAAFESRDFIDFARHGNAGRTWNTLTAFANPVLQGFDKQWRTYDLGQLKKFGGTEETQKNFRISVARLFLGGILPALVLSLLHKDDDWYKDDVQDWEKENYWILTETWRVPKGADVGLRFFSNLTEHLISSDPVRADKVLQPLKGILPDLMPTAFLPIFECMANYDLFRRQPIVPQREVNKFKDTPELQYDSTNSKLAVLLGRVTGVSPRYIDHVIYGYTSGFGKEATHLIDTVTPGRHTAWTRSDVPFFSRILRTPYRAPKIVSEYYEEFGRQESYAQRLAWEKKHGNPNAKPSTEYDPALHRRLKNIQRAMQNLNAAERAIMDDPKLTSEQVEEKREEIQKRRVELCRKAFQRAR